MQLVEAYADIHNAHTFVKSFRKKSITNFFLQEADCLSLIRDKVFFQHRTGETVFLIRKNSVHCNIYFYASSLEALNAALPDLRALLPGDCLVMDIVAREQEPGLLAVLQQHGFSSYTSLVRMSASAETLAGNTELLEALAPVRKAEPHELSELHRLFTTHFDPLSEQIPSVEQLEKWTSVDAILVCEINDRIAGFIIYEINGQTQYLRYWFVHPDFRDRRVGTALFRHFLAKGEASPRKIFWVIRSNDNAIKRYKHYGFLEENMFNFVMINKPHDERENN